MMPFDDRQTPTVMQLKNEYYKPRDLGATDVMEKIVSAVLNQEAMAMDSDYVDDVSVENLL